MNNIVEKIIGKTTKEDLAKDVRNTYSYSKAADKVEKKIGK